MKFNILAAGLLLITVFVQETLMGSLLIWHAQADLVLVMIVALAFILPPVTTDFLAFFVGLVRGIIELPVVDSLGFYPLVYLCITIPISRLLVDRIPPALLYRFPVVLAAFMCHRVLRLLVGLLLSPHPPTISASALLINVIEAGYTLLVWLVLALFFFQPLEERRRR